MFPVRVADIDHELRKEKLVFRGVDREGRPVIYIRSKNFDPKGTEGCVCVYVCGCHVYVHSDVLNRNCCLHPSTHTLHYIHYTMPLPYPIPNTHTHTQYTLFARIETRPVRNLEDATQACIWAMERCISRMPPGVEMLTCVWDRRGFSMGKNLDVPLLKNLASIMQNNCECGGGATTSCAGVG